MKILIGLVVSHSLVAVAGFALGVYMLPILTAPSAPSAADLAAASVGAQYEGHFRRDLEGSDLLHWGVGKVSVGRDAIALRGEIAPGPDYQLYLSPQFVETEADFVSLKPDMVRVGAVKTFENFIVPIPESVDPGQFSAVIIWCESFGEFITAASYR